EELVRGSQVRLSTSSFDLPLACRVLATDEAPARLAIEFNYVDGDDEEPTPIVADFVTIYIGRRSGRVLRLELPEKIVERATDGAALVLQIQKALDHLPAQIREHAASRRRSWGLRIFRPQAQLQRPQNYRAAKRAVNDLGESIGAAGLAGAFAR
ncbi:MAG TPA: hypothetical protein VFS60_19700, partial [Thermoanaerobaculia bacterium]|nr:hypothetical protein [Thermoanaerobaculia bacterium]